MKFKNILLYAALLSGMSFSSCTDFLDEDSNPNALSPGIFWKSEGDIMKGLTSVGTFIKYYKISQLIHTQSIAN